MAAGQTIACNMTKGEAQLHSDDLVGNEQALPVNIRKRHNADQDGTIVFHGGTPTDPEVKTTDWTNSKPINIVRRQVTADLSAEAYEQRAMQEFLKRQKNAAGWLV